MTAQTLTPEVFLANADHTLLAPETTREQLEAFVESAVELGVARVCVSPTLIPADKRGLEVVTVVGFPTGVHAAEVKAFEAELAVAAGADEIDMVVNPGLVQGGDWEGLEAEIRAVRRAVPTTVLKVILETAALTEEQTAAACRASEAAGADYVKTSTGFHSAGNATTGAVRVMADTVGGRLGIKASGGIRTAEAARRMWRAGATRLGISGTGPIVKEWESTAEGDRSGY